MHSNKNYLDTCKLSCERKTRFCTFHHYHHRLTITSLKHKPPEFFFGNNITECHLRMRRMDRFFFELINEKKKLD